MATAAARGLAPLRSRLDNGAVVIAKHSAATPAVTLHASFEAGTVFEPASTPGMAHFVSRTIDRGTDARTADAIAEDLDSKGVSLASTVSRHSLSLVCTCLVEDLDSLLATMAEIAMHPAFPDPEVETKRAEIITTIRQDEDNPAVVAAQGLLALLYGDGHPYGRRLRGSVANVEFIGREALRAFHAARVRPASLSLAIVGDVDPFRAVESASRTFGQWRADAPETMTLPVVAPSSHRQVRIVTMMNKTQADIAYGLNAIPRSDARFHVFALMNNILGEYSIGGRLGDRIRERQGMAYYAFSSLDANVSAGHLLVRAGVAPANVDRALASIDEEVARMAADGPTDQETAESKQYLVGSMPRRLETNVGIANFLQMMEFFDLGMDYDVRVPELLASVTRDDVHAVARDVLDPARASVVVAGPYSAHAV